MLVKESQEYWKKISKLVNDEIQNGQSIWNKCFHGETTIIFIKLDTFIKLS